MFEFLGNATSIVTSYPITSLLITVGAGAVITLVATKFRRQRNPEQQKENPEPTLLVAAGQKVKKKPKPKPILNEDPKPLPKESLKDQWLKQITQSVEDSLNARKQQYLELQATSEKLTEDLKKLQQQQKDAQENFKKDESFLNSQMNELRETIEQSETENNALKATFEEEEEQDNQTDFDLTLTIPHDVVKGLHPTQIKLPKMIQTQIHQSLLQQLAEKEKAHQSLVEQHQTQLSELQKKIAEKVDKQKQTEQQLSALRKKEHELDTKLHQSMQDILSERNEKDQEREDLEKAPLAIQIPIPPQLLAKQDTFDDYDLAPTFSPLLEASRLDGKLKEHARLTLWSSPLPTESNDSLVGSEEQAEPSSLSSRRRVAPGRTSISS